MLVIDNVTKSYGSLTALQGVSLELKAGEFFGLLGPNGAGKSTLMSLIAGLRRPDSGGIRLDGQALTPDNLGSRNKLGFVPQTIALYEDLTAEENLRIFGQLYGLQGTLLRERIDQALVTAHLQDRRRHHVKTFSGGMQRRLNIVAALLHRPKLLLCDEPTVGVDPQSRNAIFEFLQMLNSEGLAVIYSTHYMEEASKLCSRIAIIDHGRLLAIGTLPQLMTRLPFRESLRIEGTNLTRDSLAPLLSYGELTSDADAHVLTLHANTRLSDVFREAEAARLPTSSFQLTRPDLEDLFLHLTGKSLRDT
jgi:ABC-2 type transport system ATP-binding protein